MAYYTEMHDDDKIYENYDSLLTHCIFLVSDIVSECLCNSQNSSSMATALEATKYLIDLYQQRDNWRKSQNQ